MFYVYVLKSMKDYRYYIGFTHDLRRRFAEHNAARVTSTKARTPLVLVYYEAYRSKIDATKRERSLKLRSKAFGQLRRRIENCLTDA